MIWIGIGIAAIVLIGMWLVISANARSKPYEDDER